MQSSVPSVVIDSFDGLENSPRITMSAGRTTQSVTPAVNASNAHLKFGLPDVSKTAPGTYDVYPMSSATLTDHATQSATSVTKQGNDPPHTPGVEINSPTASDEFQLLLTPDPADPACQACGNTLKALKNGGYRRCCGIKVGGKTNPKSSPGLSADERQSLVDELRSVVREEVKAGIMGAVKEAVKGAFEDLMKGYFEESWRSESLSD